MLKTKRYIVMYQSEPYMYQDFDTFEEAMMFILDGETYTSQWVVTKRIDLWIEEEK